VTCLLELADDDGVYTKAFRQESAGVCSLLRLVGSRCLLLLLRGSMPRGLRFWWGVASWWGAAVFFLLDCVGLADVPATRLRQRWEANVGLVPPAPCIALENRESACDIFAMHMAPMQ
jgi:hypothetical protein